MRPLVYIEYKRVKGEEFKPFSRLVVQNLGANEAKSMGAKKPDGKEKQKEVQVEGSHRGSGRGSEKEKDVQVGGSDSGRGNGESESGRGRDRSGSGTGGGQGVVPRRTVRSARGSTSKALVVLEPLPEIEQAPTGLQSEPIVDGSNCSYLNYFSLSFYPTVSLSFSFLLLISGHLF